MRLLLDTHVLLWAARDDAKLAPEARSLIADPQYQVYVSAASIWEIAIKASLGRPDFAVAADRMRRGLVEAGYEDLDVTAEHAVAVESLPPIHRDPFDRMLIAQARCEGMVLLTADATVAAYGEPTRRV